MTLVGNLMGTQLEGDSGSKLEGDTSNLSSKLEGDTGSKLDGH